jgi:recombination protein RecR
LERREQLLVPLAAALQQTAERVVSCGRCGNLDSQDPCSLCVDPVRDDSLICVVEEVADLWALERSGAFKGRYHVLGGTLSALDGRGPEELRVASLVERASDTKVVEVIFALGATVDGQTTAHYLAERLAGCDVRLSRLAHGVPVGGQLDYLDDGTLTAAMRARSPAASS